MGAWTGPRWARVSRTLVTVALALLFLQAAATVQVVFTLQVSYGLLAVACVVGAPHILFGWGRLPSWLRWLAVGLVASYLLALVFGQEATLPSGGRASQYRGLAYLADLVFGLGIVGLIPGLWRERGDLKVLVWALAAAGTAAAVYGVYQWAAIRWHLPLQNLDNAVNTTGITTAGNQSQGAGPLGGQRIRGTFVEPHFLAAFLATMAPLAVASRLPGRWRRLVVPAVLCMGLALVLAASVPGVAILIAAALAGLTLLCVARGWVRRSAWGGGLLVAGAVLVFVVLINPASLASVTGRTAADLETTTGFRVGTWDQALDLWSTRPVTGFGPGQGSVRLASLEVVAGRPYEVLGTASGIWAAALLDGGVLALCFWALTLGGILGLGGRAILRRPDTVLVGIFVATLAAVLGSLVQGDRLDLQVWVLLGLLAAACSVPHAQRGESRHQAEQGSDGRPGDGMPAV